MEESAQTLLLRLFRDLPDPRMVGKVAHKLHDILVITVCAVISGLEHWTQIEDFAKANEAWFRTFLDLPNGIASHDTFGKVLATLAPDVLKNGFNNGSMPWWARTPPASTSPSTARRYAEASIGPLVKWPFIW